ncbi:MAG: Gfo/Idh/MocA family oxidoreductase [Tepidisphaeraceae bacterium]
MRTDLVNAASTGLPMKRIQTIAIIGTRGHFGTVLRELPDLPEQRLIAVADGGGTDNSIGVFNWARTQGRPEPQAFGSDWQRMLDVAKPDAVVIAGPFELQTAMAVEAIERGIHVMVEKPGALTWGDLSALRAAHQRRPDTHLASMLFSRYMPGFYTAHQMIRRGAIGEICLIESRKSYKLGTRGPHYRRRETYGGTILWVGSHAIDWVSWLAGVPYRSVFATHSTAHNTPAQGTMELSALCHFKLAQGCTASVAIDMHRPERAPTHGDDWARVVGTKGVLEVRPGSVQLIDRDNDGTTPIEVACDRKPWRDFIDHVEGRGQGLINAVDTLALANACLRARTSADEERVVSFDGPVDGSVRAPASSVQVHVAPVHTSVSDFDVAAAK